MQPNTDLAVGSRAPATALACSGRSRTTFPATRPAPIGRRAEASATTWRIGVGFGLLTLLFGCAGPAKAPRRETALRRPGTSNVSASNAPAGPTLQLDPGLGEASGHPISEFMYFVPLISPEPVVVTESAGNTQRARIRSLERRVSSEAFSVTCEVEITGDGVQRNTFDSTAAIRRRERQLKEGGSMTRVLGSICIEGAGRGTIEVEGVVTNQVPTVNEVRLRFTGQGKPSPVTIGLRDIRYFDGAFRAVNETVARVHTLTFQRSTNAPRMAVTVGSVKRKEAGDGLWQKFVGNVTGAAANLLIKPIRVEAAGHQAMLNFGLALALQERSFTFPPARHLRTQLGADAIQPVSAH